MQSLALAALLRRGLQASTSSGQAKALGLEQALSTLAIGLSGACHRDRAPHADQQRGAATATTTTTTASSQYFGALHASRDSEQAAALAAALLQLQQQMQEALARGQSNEVLRMLPSDSQAAAKWSPQQRAALFDLALQAAADAIDAQQARRLVGRMWRQGVPVGTVAHTAMLRALCSAGRHAEALAYLQSVPTKRQRTRMYALLLRACNEAGKLDVGGQCYEMFQRRGLFSDAQLTAEVVKLVGSGSDASAAETAWQQALASAAGSDEQQACLHAARVVALARAGQLEAAVGAMEVMLDQFSELLPVDVSSFSLIGTSSSGGSSGQSRQRGQEAVQPSAVRYMQEARNEVLAAAQAAGEHAIVRRLTSLATLRGLPPDLGTYHCLLRAAIAHGDGLAAVQEGYEELRRLGMQPTRETFSILLKACAVECSPEAAQAVFDSMPAAGVVQTRVHHNTLLHIYSHAGDLQGVDAAYQRMRTAGFSPDACTFRALLASIKHWAALETSTRAGSEGPAPRVERTMQRQVAAALLAGWVADLDACRPCQLSPALFTTLLHAYSQCGQINNVLLLMREAFNCQLSAPTTRALEGSVVAASSGGSSDSRSGSRSSSSVANTPEESGSTRSSSSSSVTAGLTQDQRSCSGAPFPSTSSAGAASSSTTGAAKVGPLSRKTLHQAKLAPSLPIYNAAIGACTRVGRWHMADAVALLHDMLAKGLSPDVHTYTSLISGCASGQQAALAREVWRQMVERGIRPTVVTHNAMLKVEVFTYGADAGAAYLRRMAEQGVEPDRASWSTLLVAARLVKRGDLIDVALEQLAGRERQEEQAAAGAAVPAAEAAQLEEQAATSAGDAAGAAEEDHRWHGYYEQQEEEDDW